MVAWPCEGPATSLVVFGGFGMVTGGEELLGDTWAFDIPTSTWRPLRCEGSPPPPRTGHSACIVRDTLFVYGKVECVPGLVATTTPSAHTASCCKCSGVFPAPSVSNSPVPCPTSGGVGDVSTHGDMYRLSLPDALARGVAAWEMVQPASALSPGPLFGHTAVADPW